MHRAPPKPPILVPWHALAARRAGDTAVVDLRTGRRWSFGELQAAATEASRAAAGAGHSPADAESVICPRTTGADFIVDLLAVWESGGVVCPLDEGVPPPDSSIWHGMRAAFPRTVLAKTTSGSTGVPRHVLFSAEALAADAAAIVRTMGLRPDLPNIGAISLAHSYGFSNLVLPLILHGIPLVLAASPLPESVRAALDAVGHGVAGGRRAVLPGVPAMWRAWHNSGLIEPGRIHLAISAGAPLPLDLEHRVWSESGVKIHNFLGSSECGGIAYDRSPRPREDAGLIGSPLDGVHLHADPSGRLVVESPAVALAYWPPDHPAASPAETGLSPGQFRTGDLAEQCDGGWRLLGRAADTLNLAGRKLHPLEIESLLRTHPAVRECLVFGIPASDPARGEEMVAAIAIAADDPAAWNHLTAWLGARLPAWKCPRHWWLCPDLAATVRGKLPRHHWRSRFLESAHHQGSIKGSIK